MMGRNPATSLSSARVVIWTVLVSVSLVTLPGDVRAASWEAPRVVPGSPRDSREFNVTLLDSGDALITWLTRGSPGGRLWAVIRDRDGRMGRPQMVSGRGERAEGYLVAETGRGGAMMVWYPVPRRGEVPHYRLVEWRKRGGFRAPGDVVVKGDLVAVDTNRSGDIAFLWRSWETGRAMASVKRRGQDFLPLQLPLSWDGFARGGDIAFGPQSKVMVVWIDHPDPAVEAVVLAADGASDGRIERVREPANEIEAGFYSGPMGTSAAWLASGRRLIGWGMATNPCWKSCPGSSEFASAADGQEFGEPTAIDAGGELTTPTFEPLPRERTFVWWPYPRFYPDDEPEGAYLSLSANGTPSAPKAIPGLVDVVVGPGGRPYVLAEKCIGDSCARRALRGFALRADRPSERVTLATSSEPIGARLDANADRDMVAVFQHGARINLTSAPQSSTR